MTPERWRQLDELCDALKDLSPGERSLRLKDADPELRSAAEALFAQQGSTLERPAWEVHASLLQAGTIVKAGMQLGPYRIERQIGAGGMGEVYRATDSRLGRAVAVKTCRQEFSGRFQREARAIASLNHRHICSLFDVGPNYLVMELLEGETLAEKLKRDHLSMEQTVLFGGEIANALAAAHAKGVVHRDIKPANIMLTKAGVKVLDFGLAKSSQDETLTGSNIVMGTPAYMAPEQSNQGLCDARTDIYSLGLVLYEMATGRRFLKGERPFFEELPERLGHVIERCLAPDPEDRWQSATDIRSELLWAAKPVQEPERAASVETFGKRRLWPWVLLSSALALVAGVTLWAFWQHETEGQLGRPLVRLDVDLGTGVSLFTENGPALALSHDGARVAFSSRKEDGIMRLYWRRLDQAAAAPLPGTEFAFAPFFSPNGEQIGFFAEGSLKKVELATGNVTVLANAVNPVGGTWGEDGVIIFNRAPSLDLWKVDANGGGLSQVPHSPSESHWRYWPQLLPGGKVVLVTGAKGLGGDVDQESIETVSLEDGHTRTLVEGAHFARHLSSGHLAYLRHGILFARPFDASRQELTGPEVPLLQSIEYSGLDGAGQFDIAANGTLIYRAAPLGSGLKMVQWMDSTGRLEPLLATPGDYRAISLSRDGKRLAIAIGEGGASDLYVYDVERRQQPARLTVGAKIVLGGYNGALAWTPDGRYLFFPADNATWWVPTEGLSQPREFVQKYEVTTISHDGARLFASKYSRETRGDGWIVPLSIGNGGPEAGHPEPLLHESFSEAPNDDSPDGRWLSYAADETGIAQVYVTEIANPARKWMVSSASGHRAFWSQSGREIFFSTFFAPLRIMAASYSFQNGVFHPDQPRPWSPVAIPEHAGQGLRSISMAPDGKRFAVLMPANQPLGNRVTFVMNFFDEVRRRTAHAK